MKILILTFITFLSAFDIYAENRALLVGIGQYKHGTGWAAIHGDADVDLLESNLKANNYNDITVLKNSQATKSAIIRELSSLAIRCKPGDKVYFHFSGHGQPVTDCNGDEGEKGVDESIVVLMHIKPLRHKSMDDIIMEKTI